MLYSLSSTEFDPLCPVEIDALPSSERGETSRRVNRVATLDGGAVFNDFGQTESGRTIRLRFIPTSVDHEASVIRLVKSYSLITVSCDDGVFLAAPERYTPSDSVGTLVLLVKQKLST